MNDLVKFGGASLPANVEELTKGLANVSAGLAANTGGMPFLRLLQTGGVFVYGQEDIETQPGSKWAVNPHSVYHGWACWFDSELLGEVMVPAIQPVPRFDDLPSHGEEPEWAPQVSMQLQCMNGEDKGVTVIYKGTANGLRTAVKHIIDCVIAQAQVDSKHLVPVVELGVDSYKHKKHGKTFTPMLEPIEWISIDTGEPSASKAEADPADESEAGDVDDVDETPDEESKVKKKSTTRRKAVEPDTDPDADEPEPQEKPQSNRRRRSAVE